MSEMDNLEELDYDFVPEFDVEEISVDTDNADLEHDAPTSLAKILTVSELQDVFDMTERNVGVANCSKYSIFLPCATRCVHHA